MPLSPCPPPLGEAVAQKMRRQAQRDTSPELKLRRALRARGLVGYRLHRRPLPTLRRTADIVFAGKKLAVFVQGCWWHGCPQHWSPPRHNRAWWVTKIEGNRQRDRETDEALAAAGWTSVRVWEHESPPEAADRVATALAAAREAGR